MTDKELKKIVVVTAQIGGVEVAPPPFTMFTFKLDGFEFSHLIHEREKFLHNQIPLDQVEVIIEVPRIVGTFLGMPVRIKISNILNSSDGLHDATD